MTVPLSGRQYEISAGALRAVVTEAGGGLRTLHHDGLALLEGYAADEPVPGAHGQLLIPWPNRVDRGRYTFGGRQHQLDITEPSARNAIHGLVRWAPWRVREHRGDLVELTHRLHGHPGYPFVLDLSVRYALDAETGLQVTVEATNAGTAAAPYGNGAHPYLSVGLPTVDDCRLTVPATTRLPTDERDLPTDREDVRGTEFDFRQGEVIGKTELNHAYTGLARDADGYAWTRLESPDGNVAVALWMDETYPWLQLFTGDALPQPGRQRTGLAVEPMSCPPNALATGEDIVTLAPGETARSRWGIACAFR